MVTTQNTQTEKKSKFEGIKERSNNLREPVATELLNDLAYFSEDGIQILKFHGSYQQDNRDNRVKGQEKDYSMMLRSRSPGGFIPPELYLTLDQLSDEYGNHTLRTTTRQAFQLHGIYKQNLKTAIAAIVKSMGSTLGACGDLNRNVMTPPTPFKNRPEYEYAWEYANNIADLLAPQTGAYYEIWLDGEKFISAEEAPEVKEARNRNQNGVNLEHPVEPIYGDHYMPRKFKCSVTVPGDNSIDIYTHDLSLVVITNKKGELQGFNILAGGGMGRTHRKEDTFPRVADEIGYVGKDHIYDLVKAIVATQRDYGDRVKRPHARMKYLINDWGVEKFKAKVEEYFGKKIASFKKLPKWKNQDFLGWNDQGDEKLFFGLNIENGRVKDEGDFRLKTALKEVVSKFNLPMRVTANQNVVLYDINPENKGEIEEIFQNNGIITNPNNLEKLTRYSMACPALPTCGLAVTESERVLPSINQRIRALLDSLGMKNDHFVIRMTGCPNGCARPYMAELGFVGTSPETYQIWLGGTPNQTQLAQTYLESLPIDQLEAFLEPLLVFFKAHRQKRESFGEYCSRVGFDALREFAESYELGSYHASKGGQGRKIRHRIGIHDELYTRLKAKAEETGKTMTEVMSSALETYL